MVLVQYFEKNDVPTAFILSANGSSMIPAIVKGDKLHFEKNLSTPNEGEIILAKLDSGRLVIHRLVSLKPEIRTKGDTLDHLDEPVQEILATLVKVEQTWRSRLRRLTLFVRKKWN